MTAPARMRPGEEKALSDALALAFRDSPLNRAVIRGDEGKRLHSNTAGMRALLAAARDDCSIWVARSAGRIAGGLIAMSPGTWPLAPPPLLEQLRVLVCQGPGVAWRWAEVFEALEIGHPAEPSWYLAMVGVVPTEQGRGLGAALVARWLEEVDAAPAAVFLETDRPELLPFYGRFGFAFLGSAELMGVPIRSLWRPGPAGLSPTFPS